MLMTELERVILLIVCGTAINLPFGAWRATVKRLSWKWFAAIHLPIPFLFLLRTALGFSLWFIPVSLAGALAGQLLGSWLLHRARAARAAQLQVAVSVESDEALSGKRF